MKYLCNLTSSVLAMLVLTTNANASLITYSYNGIANWNFGGGPEIMALDGEILTITYTFDSTATDIDPTSNVGEYAISSAIATIGPYAYTASSGKIFVNDDDGLADSYIVSMPDVSGPSLDGNLVDNLFLSLRDPTKTAITGDSLPAVQPDPINFQNLVPHMFLGFGPDSFSSSLQVSQGAMISTVPLPATAWLFGSGLIGLIGIARRKTA